MTIYVHFHVFPVLFNGMEWMLILSMTRIYSTQFKITLNNRLKAEQSTMIMYIKAKNKYNGSKKRQPFVHFQ